LGDSELTKGISEGIVTGKNSVLLIHKDDVVKYGIERDFLKKSLRGEDVKRYQLDWGGYYLIYPYVLNEEKTEVLSEDRLKKSCPNLHTYLVERRSILEARTYLQDGGKDWYEIWCPRDIRQQECPKIVVPELADRSQFAFTGKDLFYVDTTCGITLSEKCPFDLWYLLGVLNSRPAEYLYRKTTVPKANGFLIYKTMFLNTLRIPVPSNEKNKASVPRVSELARKIQEVSSVITTLEHTFDECLQATLPLLDATQQSFKSDYYEIAGYWKARNLISPGALNLTEPVSGILVANDVVSTAGEIIASPRLTISYQSERATHWKKLVEIEPANEELRTFILFAARRFLRENARKRTWKLHGPRASKRTVDVVLGSIALPIWGLLHGTGDRTDTNLRKISEVMQTLRTQVRGEINPSVLEARRHALDQEIDDLVFELYGMDKEERELVLGAAAVL